MGEARREDRASGIEEAPEWGPWKVVVVLVLAQVGGFLGSVPVFLALLAPCALPYRLLAQGLGSANVPLLVLSVVGGFISGSLIGLHLPRFRWRLMLLFFGNPAFTMFLIGVVPEFFPGVRQRLELAIFQVEPLALAAFAVVGTSSAALGDWHGWRRAERVGLR